MLKPEHLYGLVAEFSGEPAADILRCEIGGSSRDQACGVAAEAPQVGIVADHHSAIAGEAQIEFDAGDALLQRGAERRCGVFREVRGIAAMGDG